MAKTKAGTFNEVRARAWRLAKRGLSDATRENYVGVLDTIMGIVGDRQVRRFNRAAARKLFEQIERERGVTTGIATYRNALSGFLAAARDLGYLDSDPLEGIKFAKHQEKEGHRLSEREERLLLAHADDEHRPLFAFMLATGVRLGEALGLHWQDVERDGITVRRSRPDSEAVKNKRVRWVPLIAQSRGALEDMRGRSPLQLRGASFVFPSDLAYKQACNRIRRALARAALAAGLPELGTHDFRRTFAARCDERGLTVFEIRDLLGHSSVKVTEKYVGRVKRDRLAAAVGRLEAPAIPLGAVGGGL